MGDSWTPAGATEPEVESYSVVDHCRGCGKELRPFEKEIAGRMRPCYPRNPCGECAETMARRKRDELISKAQARAEIPDMYRALTFDRVERQGTMSMQKFREAVADRSVGQKLGIPNRDQLTFQKAYRWARSAEKGSVWLAGEVGTGKTALMAAAATASMGALGEFERVQVSRARFTRVYGPVTDERWQEIVDSGECTAMVTPGGSASRRMQWVTEGEVHSRVRLSWEGDRGPLLKISKTPMLFLDDFGTAISKSENRQSIVRENIERLVDYRYQRRLPIFITSNFDMRDEQLVEEYGERTMSRIHHMVGDGGYWELRGVDWRA